MSTWSMYTVPHIQCVKVSLSESRWPPAQKHQLFLWGNTETHGQFAQQKVSWTNGGTCTCWRAASRWGRWSHLCRQTVSSCCLKKTRRKSYSCDTKRWAETESRRLKLRHTFIVAAVGEVLTLDNLVHNVICINAGVVHTAGLLLHALLLSPSVGGKKNAS